MAVKDTYSAQSAGPQGGVAFVAPLGTVLPTDATTTLDNLAAEWAAGHLGTLTDDGLVRKETRTSNPEKNFDGSDYVDNQKEYGIEYEFTLFDVTLRSVKELLYGASNVTFIPADATHGNRYIVKHNAEQLPIQSFFFWTKSGKKRHRDVAQYARVSEIGELPFKAGEAAKIKVTIRVSPGDDGDHIKEYEDDGEIAPGPITKTVTSTGAWRFGLGGQFTAEIAADAASSAVKAAIEALSTFTGTCTVTGSTGGPYQVTLSNGGTITVSGDAVLS